MNESRILSCYFFTGIHITSIYCVIRFTSFIIEFTKRRLHVTNIAHTDFLYINVEKTHIPFNLFKHDTNDGELEIAYLS